MQTQEISAEELRAWKAGEAQERMRLLAAGESGAWPWPKDSIVLRKPHFTDERWLCELELAGC